MSSSPLLVYSLDRLASYRSAALVLTALGLVVSALLWLWFGHRTEQETAGGASVPWVAAMLLLGLGPLVAWAVGMRRYIRQVRWDAASGQVELTLLGPMGGRVVRVAPAEFAETVRFEGKLAIPFRVKVDAPYHRIRTGGSLGTLILDGQGTVHDAAALEAILAGRAPRS